MKPWPKLQRVPVSEWIASGGISLGTDLDLFLKAEISGERELPGEILEEARDRIHGLPVQRRNGKEKQRNQSYEGQILESYVSCRHRSSLVDDSRLGGET